MDRRSFVHTLTAAGLTLASPLSFSQTAPSTAPQKQSLVGVDAKGAAINLESYAGKIVLVSFFTAACPLCTHDLKLMREFYERNKTRQFALLGVNVDARKEDFMEYAHVVDLSVSAGQRFPMIWRNAPQHADTFGPIVKQPTHFVLDRNLQQILKREGTFQPDDWDMLWTRLG